MTDSTTPDRRQLAIRLLDQFAHRTGLDGERPPKRYLWTDAFAVCAFLGLHEDTGEARFLDLALHLVHQVHRVLGRHRPDDPRAGWISGLDDADGRDHPTAAGLRIGKPDPERAPGEPEDPRGEWDRDGQYYHYLTRWMHALDRTAAVTGDARFHRWAVELAAAAHAGFVVREGPGAPRLHWKMSIDLSRPLVASSGQHDALDGRITIELLRAHAPDRADDLLHDEAAELDRICHDRSWTTADALGTGGLLTDALRLAQLRQLHRPLDPSLEQAVLRDGLTSLHAVRQTLPLRLPPAHRLPFRELGLALGLHAASRTPLDDPDWQREIRRHRPMGTAIEDSWTTPRAWQSPTWAEHVDINAVMLAVALQPDGYLAP